ncbi:four helix bundle protein [bacterium]|nr:four helix bundle protein [bacterium]
MFRFEKLDVWQVAVEFADQVYAVTGLFPSDERFGLTNQARRSAVSISANIAEGSGRSTDKEFVRFLEIAYGSLMETVSHLKIAERQSFLETGKGAELYETADRLSRMLSGLRNHRLGN